MVTRCYDPFVGGAVVTLLAATLLVQGHARGDEVSAPAAQVLFDEGRRLVEESRYEEACEKFAESQNLDAAVGTLLNLAACHERMGKLASAYAKYSEAHAMSLRQNDPARGQFARDAAASLEPRLSRVLIVLPDEPLAQSAWVSLDGTRLPTSALSTPIPVDPGEHRIDYGASGKHAGSVTVTVTGAATVVTATLPRLRPIPVQPGVPPGKRGTASDGHQRSEASAPRAKVEHLPAASGSMGTTTLAGASFGFAALALAMGSYFGYQAVHSWDERESHCSNGGCDRTGVRAGDRAESAAHLSNVLFAAGGVALGAGTYLLVDPQWFGRTRSGSREKQSAEPSAVTLVARGCFP